jgi:hypothetical protein
MNKRFAQILTDATDPRTGMVDRARLFSALEADPSDPTAAMFDAAAFTFETVEELKSTLPLAVTERIKKLLDYHEASQRTNADRISDAASVAASTSRDLRKWGEESWAQTVSETRKQVDSMRASAINAAAKAENAIKEAERSLRISSDELIRGKRDMMESWKGFLKEANSISKENDRACLKLVLIVFGIGVIIGAVVTHFPWW